MDITVLLISSTERKVKKILTQAGAIRAEPAQNAAITDDEYTPLLDMLFRPLDGEDMTPEVAAYVNKMKGRSLDEHIAWLVSTGWAFEDMTGEEVDA